MPSPLRTLRKTMKSLVSHVWFTRSIRLNGRKLLLPRYLVRVPRYPSDWRAAGEFAGIKDIFSAQDRLQGAFCGVPG